MIKKLIRLHILLLEFYLGSIKHTLFDNIEVNDFEFIFTPSLTKEEQTRLRLEQILYSKPDDNNGECSV